MSNIDIIKSLLPDNTNREISPEDLRDSFQFTYDDIENSLTEDKANLLYLALSEFVNNGKIRADKIEALALSELIVAIENSLSEFMANNIAYEYQIHDFIAIPDGSGNYSLYMFRGGNKTVSENYIPLGLSKITISMVEGLQNVLNSKLEKPSVDGNFLLNVSGGLANWAAISPAVNYLLFWNGLSFNQSNTYFDGNNLGIGLNNPSELLHVNGRVRSKALLLDNNIEEIPGQITYFNRRFRGTDVTGIARNFMYADFSDYKALWLGFTAPEKNEIRSFLNLSDGYTGYLRLNTPAPNIAGLYRLIELGSYNNLTPALDNNDNPTTITAIDGKINDAYYDGSNWRLTNLTIPGVTAKQIFDPTNNIDTSVMKAIADRYDKTLSVLKTFLVTTKVVWEEINMPTSGENDNAVIILPGYSQHPTPNWANGFIPLSYFNGYEFIKVEGNLSSYGSNEIIWLGRGKDTAPTSYGTYLTGVPANNIFEMPVPTGSNIEYIIYSRKKGDTKFYRGKTVTVPVEEDGVLNRILAEIAAVKKSELNFKDFGAKCDGITNDTNAFKSAINYLISQGGGKIRLSGTILINQTAIPFVDYDRFMTIEIVGDYMPTGVFGSVGSMPVNKNNSTILCQDVNYDDAKGVIYTTKGTSNQWAFNYITFVLRNLVIRTTDGAPIHALNLYNFQQAIVENVNIDTGVYAGQAAEPTVLSAGLISPSRDNGGWALFNNVSISGYNIAFIPQEHTNADNIQINCCKVALQIQGAGHPALIKRVLVQKCPRVVVVKNQATFEIEQLVIEKASPATITPGHEWQLPDAFDFYDTGNNGRGFITWNTTVGGVTLDGTFNRTGGTNVRTRRIGDANWVNS
ncbi:hypothetical protein EGI16_03390 [Chryseobacterium sp. G0240]|uniref:glycosyl hydrolase family 28-related protein n=1 Tax=Chryseobacterium sp. G0240 TaxID=2487066 RepID=UPI000F454A03|nr:hypothetical protein [Chryseobacterium sp. G0240]ROI05443.1 hypothetical protein EGI16_03390 [Chryseobacterium sp. G0240]